MSDSVPGWQLLHTRRNGHIDWFFWGGTFNTRSFSLLLKDCLWHQLSVFFVVKRAFIQLSFTCKLSFQFFSEGSPWPGSLGTRRRPWICSTKVEDYSFFSVCALKKPLSIIIASNPSTESSWKMRISQGTHGSAQCYKHLTPSRCLSVTFLGPAQRRPLPPENYMQLFWCQSDNYEAKNIQYLHELKTSFAKKEWLWNQWGRSRPVFVLQLGSIPKVLGKISIPGHITAVSANWPDVYWFGSQNRTKMDFAQLTTTWKKKSKTLGLSG